MICPECRQNTLAAEYRRIPATQSLDLGYRQPQYDRELAALACRHCGASWYALANETPQTAYRRIRKEEPRT